MRVPRACCIALLLRHTELGTLPHNQISSCLYRFLSRWDAQLSVFGKDADTKTMWSRTKEVFRRRPLLMNMASFGTMYVGAEVAQQTILVTRFPEKSRDWESVRRYAIIGLGGIGPALFYWYRILDRVLPGTTRKVVAAKVLADQLISSTSCLVIFFTGMSILEGKEDIFAELRAKFLSTYTLSCCFWLPAQAINFALLPPYTRVAFVGVASFVWVNVLCLVKRQKYVEEKDDESPTIVLESGAK